jgi:hypothetical protein
MEARLLESEALDFVVPAKRNRWVLVHHHILKNAGSTILHVLRRSFRSKFATMHGPDPDSVLNGADVAAFLIGNPDLAAVSSHHIRYPTPTIPQVIVFDLCFFRDPLHRLWSMYKYLRRAEPVDDLTRSAKSLDSRPFFRHLLQEYPHVINDAQVSLLASRGEYTRPPAETDLRLALDSLHGISVLGVVDLFDQSALAAEYFLRPTFPALRFHYVKQNADPASHPSLELEKEAFRSEVGEDIFRQLERMNELDTELVASARKEVLRRFAMLPDQESRLADFQERCAILRATPTEMLGSQRMGRPPSSGGV